MKEDQDPRDLSEKDYEAAAGALMTEILEMPDGFCSITNFLIDKSTDSIKREEGKEFENYPIDVVLDGQLKKGYIQDAKQEIQGRFYQLTMIIMAGGTLYTIRKQCLAPEGCQVDWDNIHCAFDLVHRREESLSK